MNDPAVRTHVVAWLALLALLALTLGSAYVPLHGFNTAINLGIACAKASIVAIFFMRLRSAGTLVRLAAAIGAVWLALLIGLGLTDFLH